MEIEPEDLRINSLNECHMCGLTHPYQGECRGSSSDEHQRYPSGLLLDEDRSNVLFMERIQSHLNMFAKAYRRYLYENFYTPRDCLTCIETAIDDELLMEKYGLDRWIYRNKRRKEINKIIQKEKLTFEEFCLLADIFKFNFDMSLALHQNNSKNSNVTSLDYKKRG